MLLAASYLFYGWWDWRFLSLLIFTTALDFMIALKMSGLEDPARKKKWLILSIAANLGILGFFKYFNFFEESLVRFFQLFHLTLPPFFLSIILPVGISFYTFQSMSYTIDVYRGRLNASRNFLDFALYVAFFPQLVAGPIERATHLLPQVAQARTLRWENISEGSFLMLTGFVKKIVIADNLGSRVVDPIFGAGYYGGWMSLLAAYAFAFQIYCDFSGYSDIARGTAKWMGFDIMLNFKLPYFAANPKEFWQRWHISLSTWLKDYLYIPLGGNQKGRFKTYRNLLITMLLGGLWHGAAWTYVLWGLYHGFLLMIHRFWTETVKFTFSFSMPWSRFLWRTLKTVFFFHVICLGWILFRASDLSQAGSMIASIGTLLTAPQGMSIFDLTYLRTLLFFGLPLLFIQGFQAGSGNLETVLKWRLMPRAVFYVICFYFLIFYGGIGGKPFIYFQF